ncbi:unnamed protein product [Musa acuminata subsp. malaccensis]|uniref:(wild Malaysian banana) hypothetical protein n=1 Tax=Musa acuminata subsp. malaccensis TaxID=214687 RepID=A0A804KK16_MUSAM|nr:unnamed protein product [Musa acuminata subsp. malaccensis]
MSKRMNKILHLFFADISMSCNKIGKPLVRTGHFLTCKGQRYKCSGTNFRH